MADYRTHHFQADSLYTVSVHYDRRLYSHDIDGSIAHARMLARQGILSQPDAGAIIGYCTDTTYDALAGLEHELKSMNVVFSTQDMVKIMGPNTAAYLGMEKELGTLEAGKLADIILLDGDPLAGYWNWLKTKVTIKEGKVVVDRR